jgi:hypothetical protein
MRAGSSCEKVCSRYYKLLQPSRSSSVADDVALAGWAVADPCEKEAARRSQRAERACGGAPRVCKSTLACASELGLLSEEELAELRAGPLYERGEQRDLPDIVRAGGRGGGAVVRSEGIEAAMLEVNRSK